MNTQLLRDPETGVEFPVHTNGDLTGDVKITLSEEQRERFLVEDDFGPGTVTMRIPVAWMLELLGRQLGNLLISAVQDLDGTALLRMLTRGATPVPDFRTAPEPAVETPEEAQQRVRGDVADGYLPPGYPPRDLRPFPLKPADRKKLKRMGVSEMPPDSVPACIVDPLRDQIEERTGGSLEELADERLLKMSVLVELVRGRPVRNAKDVCADMSILARGEIPAPDGEGSWPALGTRCGACGEPQFLVPGGPICRNGHGGTEPAAEE